MATRGARGSADDILKQRFVARSMNRKQVQEVMALLFPKQVLKSQKETEHGRVSYLSVLL